MGVTLILGRGEDLCCSLVADRLGAAGREFIFLKENELFPGMTFAWQLHEARSTGFVGLASDSIPLDRLDGVLARFSGIATSAEEHQTKDGQYLNSEWHALARGFMQSLPCPVVNRLRPELWYKSRLAVPDVLSLLPQQRFRLPRTMVTTKFDQAAAFFEKCHRRMFYSPLSVPSDYLIDTESALAKLEPLSKTLPLALTEAVAGDPVDAYVAGSEVVLDGPSDGTAARLCLEAAAMLGLSFCQFDLIRTQDGDWYCRGIQCAPNLFGCSNDTRNAIADLLVSALTTAGTERMLAA